jgi:hypothetical protein
MNVEHAAIVTGRVRPWLVSHLGRHLPNVIPGAAAIVALAGSYRLHAFFLESPGPVGFDDGYTMSLGERLIDGSWLPYVDGCSHRGPLLYWAAAIAQALTGRFGWLGTRLLCAVTNFATVVFLVGAGVAVRRPLAGALAALFYVWSALSVVSVGGAFAVTGEGVASPFAVAAVMFCGLGVVRAEAPSRRVASLVVAGGCAALAGLAKQTILPCIVPLLVWCGAVALATDGLRRRERWAMPGALFLGFALVLIVTLARYVVRGELGTFWYWYVRYNADIYMLPYRGTAYLPEIAAFIRKHPWEVGPFGFVLAVAIARPFSQMEPGWSGFIRGYARTGFETTSALIAFAMFAAAISALRFWPHYFLCVYPFVGLVIGMHADLLLENRSSRPWGAVGNFVVALAFAALTIEYSEARIATLEKERAKGSWKTPVDEPLCPVLDAWSKPGDTLFVWGFHGNVYLSCRRRPAARFTYLTMVAGVVPPFWRDVRKERVAVGAREALLADLKKEPPPVILDLPSTMGKVSMMRVPSLAKFVRKQYCDIGSRPSKSGGAAQVWVRADLGACATR